MKLQRHGIARGTVSELQSIRPISPQEAAAAETAKFDLIGAGLEVAEGLGRVRQKRIFEESKLSAAEAGIRRKSALSALKTDPMTKELMKENPNYMTEETEHIRSLALEDISKIQDRTVREQAERMFEAEWEGIRSDMAHSAEKMSIDIGRDRGIAGILESLQNDNPEGAEELFDASIEYYDETTRVKLSGMIQEGYDLKQATELFEGYKANKEQGTEAEFNAELAESGYSEDVKSEYRKMVTQYESLLKAEQSEIDAAEAEARDKRVVDYERGIQLSTTDEELHAFADTEDLSRAERRALFARRERLVTSAETLFVGDPTSEKYRKSLDEMTQLEATTINEDGERVLPTPAEIFSHQIDNVGKTGAIGENLNNFLIRAAQSDYTSGGKDPNKMTPEERQQHDSNLDYMSAVHYYAQIMKNNPLTKLNGLDKDTFNFLQNAYASAERMGGTDAAYRTAGKEQQAIHIRREQGPDSIDASDAEFNQLGWGKITEDLGDKMESMDIDIPGAINDREFQFSSALMVTYKAAAKNIARYMQATEGRIDWSRVQNMAIQRTVANFAPNFVNDGVPSGGRTFVTDKGVIDEAFIEPQLDVNTLKGADTPEGASLLRRMLREEYEGKTVQYQGRTYTLTAKIKEPEVILYDPLGMPIYETVTGEKDVISIDNIELFTGPQPRYDNRGATAAELRFMNMPIYDPKTGMIAMWSPEVPEDYETPEGKTDISGGPKREDINPRISEAPTL